MEWYSGSGIDDFVVPEDREVYDRLPSPESWSKWCADASESHEFSNKRFLMDSKLTGEELKFNGEILSKEVESFYNGKDQSSGSSISGRLSEESLPQTALSCDQPDYQLDDLSEIEQLDEFFLSSFLEDLPRNENLNGSFCFSAEAECGMASADNRFTDTMSDLQSISNDAHGMGSSKYLKTHAFSPSLSWEEGEVAASHFNQCNSDQKDLAPVKASLVNVLVPSEHDSMIGLVDEETSLQQSALQELEMVMAQLNDKTRICFRDALYRLASNSKQHPIKQDQNGDLSMETPGTGEDEKMGSGGKTTIEMETNAIDRAIANLMFCKMDLNIRDFPVSAPVNSKQGISRETKPLNCRWNEPQGHDLPSYPSFRGDAEVPILGHGYRQIRANPGKHM
ncbi:protein LNK3-like [Populus alba x Populus x berolinensis]|uniref:Protein LNK3-like n=1 Tax=Populus alba x Populus x berolinensis TaxID=444605 RepID=A0AAD6RJ21_9ROSI|nr:protein LNK3-like [Populus alba x Populus x berolinensis]KAJ7009783.1 protein LNK3-like [Populus alba x Populus x berolinensis]